MHAAAPCENWEQVDTEISLYTQLNELHKKINVKYQ